MAWVIPKYRYKPRSQRKSVSNINTWSSDQVFFYQLDQFENSPFRGRLQIASFL